MKRGLILHWEQWGKRENVGWRRGECNGTLGRSIDARQKFPLGPWCSVVFLLAILAGMSPSLCYSEFSFLSKLIWMFLLKTAFSGLGTACFDWLLSLARDKSFLCALNYIVSWVLFIFIHRDKRLHFTHLLSKMQLSWQQRTGEIFSIFRVVFLISFNILLWQWKLEKDQSKNNTKKKKKKARNCISNSCFLLMLLGKYLTTEAPVCLFCAPKWA